MIFYRRDQFIMHLLLLSALFIAGCNAPKSNLLRFDASFRSDCFKNSGFDSSLNFAASKVSNSKNPKGEDLLWNLQIASIDRLKQNYKQSNDYFDKSEDFLNYFDYQNTTVDSAAAVAVNENIIPYTGEEYDGIMVNTYKALNFMSLGENDTARVEFNRALDRQRRAKEKFAQEIAKLQNDIDNSQKKTDTDVKRNVDNPEIQTLIANRYPNVYDFKAYPDFVNPFTTYIAGVFFELIGDYSKAAPLIKESYGMVSDNKYIGEDLVATEQVLDGQNQLKDTVWVVFENGLGPVKEEFRIDIPLFVATNKVKYIGIALPSLKFRQQAYPYLTITAGGRDYQTQQVADMDRIIQTEFNKDFKAILTRAIISATAKAVAQYALERQRRSSTSLASALVAVYSFATTAADVRIWTTLPKDFQVARFTMPADRTITVKAINGELFQIKIPPCNNSLVYVKIPFSQAKSVYNLITY
jgi:hypothetical protein